MAPSVRLSNGVQPAKEKTTSANDRGHSLPDPPRGRSASVRTLGTGNHSPRYAPERRISCPPFSRHSGVPEGRDD